MREVALFIRAGPCVDVSQKWRILYRFPPTGPPLVLIVESVTGLMVKFPAVTSSDHVMVTKEPGGMGKHLTDETVKEGKGRHQHLGKMTSETVPVELLESLSVELKDDEPIYIFASDPTPSGGILERKHVPGRDLVPTEDFLKMLATVDLDSIPLLRKATWGQARKSGLPHGLRKEGGDLVLYVQRQNGKVIRFPLIGSVDKLPIVAEVSGLGALFERAGLPSGGSYCDERPWYRIGRFVRCLAPAHELRCGVPLRR